MGIIEETEYFNEYRNMGKDLDIYSRVSDIRGGSKMLLDNLVIEQEKYEAFGIDRDMRGNAQATMAQDQTGMAQPYTDDAIPTISKGEMT